MLSSRSIFSLFLAALFSPSSSQTFYPASIPLAIRSPYMNVWQPSTFESGPLSNSSAMFWNQTHRIGWGGRIRIDGNEGDYTWMGPSTNSTPAKVNGIQITPTKSVYNMTAGPVDLTVTFLSPIEPSNIVNQSLPFSYVTVIVKSGHNQAHHIELYSEITAQWVSGDDSSVVKWNTSHSDYSHYHEVELEDPQPNIEIAQQAQDGKGYYAMVSSPNMAWQIDTPSWANQRFSEKGMLRNKSFTYSETISPNFTVSAFSLDLGEVQSSVPITWAVGFVRNPSVSYTTPSGKVNQLPYFIKYSSVPDAIDAFLADFPAAQVRATTLDEKIISDARKISPEYADLVSLCTRQVLGSLDITVLDGLSNDENASNVRVFMKDIGTSGRVNPVERIYAAFPAFLYLNPSLGAALLKPLLESQNGSATAHLAARDLGSSYPTASGPQWDMEEGVEQSGNMLIMMYAYARVSGDGTLLWKYYNLIKSWGMYLVDNALAPQDQRSADNEPFANMTNLAVKGIIGVKAMAEISNTLGNAADAEFFGNQATALSGAWQSLATSADGSHLLGFYGNDQSWSLLYNIYADRLLGTSIIPQDILINQTKFYDTLLDSGCYQAPPFGLPIDSSPGQSTNLAWTLFTSAVVTDQTVRDKLIQHAWERANLNATQGPLPNIYDGRSGYGEAGAAGPSLGAVFAHLALTIPGKRIEVPAPIIPNSPSPTASHSYKANDVATIVSGAVGGAVFFIIAVTACLYHVRRRAYRKRTSGRRDKFIILTHAHSDPVAPPLPTLCSQHSTEPDSLSYLESSADSVQGNPTQQEEGTMPSKRPERQLAVDVPVSIGAGLESPRSPRHGRPEPVASPMRSGSFAVVFSPSDVSALYGDGPVKAVRSRPGRLASDED